MKKTVQDFYLLMIVCPMGLKNSLSSFEEKHLSPLPLYDDALIDRTSAAMSQTHPILFDCINGKLIRNMALCTTGAAGPSGLDAA